VMQEEILKRKGGFWDHLEDIFHTLGLKHEEGVILCRLDDW
jgi:hypothetical protein